MDANKVRTVITTYRTKFLPLKNLRKNALEHCHGMLDQMEGFANQGRMSKAFRWLGFIQGVLWVLRVYTLEDLKNHNRPTE